MIFPRTFPCLLAALTILGASACTTHRKPVAAVPPGFSADARDTYADGRGKDSKRWPTAQPLFSPDLSNADFTPGAWAFNSEGILSPTRRQEERHRGSLWTKETYADFVLNLDFRLKTNGNSGVLLRGSHIDRPSAEWIHHCIEVQIRQGDEKKPVHLVGAIYDVSPPKRQVPITPGQWYRYTITAKGPTITVALDGEEVNKINLDEWTEPGRNPDGTKNKFRQAYNDLPREGRVGVQDHGDSLPEFRNLYIERL